MLARVARLTFRIMVAGVAIGAATAALGLGAIAISELVSRRAHEDADEFASFDATEATGAPQELDEEFLSLLACPVCKTSVRREGDRLICSTCGRRYPIRDGIPVMLVEEAEVPGAGAASAG
ncbi:MAG TPA: Trm112 family protein [Chloroflexota bacterium]|nr:Trm112 family protein [Chloroflexota bacterium]